MSVFPAYSILSFLGCFLVWLCTLWSVHFYASLIMAVGIRQYLLFNTPSPFGCFLYMYRYVNVLRKSFFYKFSVSNKQENDKSEFAICHFIIGHVAKYQDFLKMRQTWHIRWFMTSFLRIQKCIARFAHVCLWKHVLHELKGIQKILQALTLAWSFYFHKK